MTSSTSTVSQDILRQLQADYPLAFGRSVPKKILLTCLWLTGVVLVFASLSYLEVSLSRILGGMDRIGLIAGGFFPPGTGGAFQELLHALFESIAMAFLGTLIAAVLATVLGLLGARNIIPVSLFRIPVRRSFDFLRGVDALVWALVYVRAVGLGPLAGVLAIATSDTGTLAKLSAEAIESADRKQVDGVKASGGNRIQTLRFGIIPQVLPIMISNALYMFESNTRSATILGIVGAGGIGFQLADRIRAHRWDEVGFIILMIIGAVFIIDLISRFLRSRIIHQSSDKTTQQHDGIPRS